MSRLLPLLLGLSACGWNFRPDYETWIDDVWDPQVIPASDGVYVRLPAAGLLARVTPDGKSTAVDLGGARPDRVAIAPDHASLLVSVSWEVCHDEDRRIKTPDDCDSEDLETVYATDLVRDGQRVGSVDVPPAFNAWTFDANTGIAAATVDLDGGAEIDVSGVLNLTEVVFVEVADGTAHRVPIGFAAEEVLFTLDGSRALVFSRSTAAVIDFATWSESVTFPFTLDADQTVTAEEAVLTPDGNYALVRVGSADLYALDLANPHMDLIELDKMPADLLVDNTSDVTIAVSAQGSGVSIIDHAVFEVTTLETDEPMDHAVGGDGMAFLYNEGSGYKDVYLLDTTKAEIEEFRAENPILDVWLSADHAVAVATTEPESSSGSGATALYDRYYGLSVFPLVAGADPIPLILESRPVGLELVESDGRNYALLLLEGVDNLLQVDLESGQAVEIALPVAPLGVFASPDGRFVITHEATLGMISILDPATNALTNLSGFGQLGLLADPGFADRATE